MIACRKPVTFIISNIIITKFILDIVEPLYLIIQENSYQIVSIILNFEKQMTYCKQFILYLNVQ